MKIFYILLSFLIILNFNNVQATSNKLIVGISADYPPFDMIIDNEIAGLDADIAKMIATQLDYELVFKEMDFAGLIPALNSGIIDIAISNISSTPERTQVVDFTIPYYNNKAVVIYPNHLKFENIKNFSKTDKIGVQLGTNFHDFLKSNLPNETIALSKIPILFEELKQGKIDYLILDQTQGEFFIKHNSQNFKSQLLTEFDGKIAIAVKQNSLLTVKLNQIISQLSSTGQLAKLEQKWLIDYSVEGKINSHIFNQQNIIYIAKGVGITLIYAIGAAFFGLMLSLILTLISQISKFGKAFSKVYISLIRGTPLILQLSLIYFGLPNLLDVKIPIILAGLIGFSINSAAYIFEHIKAGIKSIDQGQIDAAIAMGMQQKKISKLIVIPQAIRNITPSIINEIINLIKETSIISIFGVSDIMRRANIVAADSYDFLTPLLIAGLCYYLLITLFSFILNIIESKFRLK